MAELPKKKPWWYERPGPAAFNEWSLAHLATGFVYGATRPGRYLEGLAVHTGYEVVEGQIFPVKDRDVSMENHVGDSIAFFVGMVAGSKTQGRQRS